MLTLGIDDAARGPLIGGMYLAGVLIDENGETALKRHGVKDSKMLQNPMRIRLSKFIKESAISYKVVSTSPEQIDKALNSGTNLNSLEAIKTAEIINALNPKKEKIKVIVDCPSTNTLKWRSELLGLIDSPKNIDLHCEHKADANYVSVSAASILAKVKREEEIEELKKKYGEIGSGYPADPITKKFLKKNGKTFRNSGIFRKTWKTWKKIFPEEGQKTLF